MPDTPLTQLLALASSGDRAALDQVFESLYPELRKIAHARLREHQHDESFGTTALVHETFIRLVDASRLVLTDRKHFFTYAAKTMRNTMVDLAREHLSQRRGAGVPPLTLNTAVDGASVDDGGATLVRIHDALLALEALDPALARVVEMRYFGGYIDGEIAELTDTSERTVRRQWDKARAFLLATLQE